MSLPAISLPSVAHNPARFQPQNGNKPPLPIIPTPIYHLPYHVSQQPIDQNPLLTDLINRLIQQIFTLTTDNTNLKSENTILHAQNFQIKESYNGIVDTVNTYAEKLRSTENELAEINKKHLPCLKEKAKATLNKLLSISAQFPISSQYRQIPESPKIDTVSAWQKHHNTLLNMIKNAKATLSSQRLQQRRMEQTLPLNLTQEIESAKTI